MKAKSSAAPAKNAARNHAAPPQAQHLAKAHAAVKSLVESPGRPLDPNTKDAMQSRFGYDFSSVRVHADDKASESARMLGAHAYTTGHHIAFGDGKYAPQTASGRNLVAHELTHVVQQAHGPVEGTAHGALSISHPNDSHERAADHAAKASMPRPPSIQALSVLPSPTFGSAHLPIQRQGPPSWLTTIDTVGSALEHPFNIIKGLHDWSDDSKEKSGGTSKGKQSSSANIKVDNQKAFPIEFGGAAEWDGDPIQQKTPLKERRKAFMHPDVGRDEMGRDKKPTLRQRFKSFFHKSQSSGEKAEIVNVSAGKHNKLSLGVSYEHSQDGVSVELLDYESRGYTGDAAVWVTFTKQNDAGSVREIRVHGQNSLGDVTKEFHGLLSFIVQGDRVFLGSDSIKNHNTGK